MSITVTSVKTKDELVSMARLRHRAYVHLDLTDSHPSGMFRDDLDQSDGVHNILACDGDTLAGTLRLVLRERDEPIAKLQSYATWPAEVEAFVREQRAIEISRFAVDPRFQGFASHAVKFALLKAAVFEVICQEVTHWLGFVRLEHLDFYLNVLGMRCAGEPRRTWLRSRPYLVTGTMESALRTVRERMPSLLPSEQELRTWANGGGLVV